MPPRKRGGRRGATKSRAVATPSSTPAADDAPSTPSPSSTAPDSNTPALDSPAASLPVEIPTPSAAPDSDPNPSSPTPPSQTPAETTDLSPLSVPSEAPAPTPPVPDVSPAAETSEPRPCEEAPSEEEPSQVAKSATRVRKVIKKKIVKKRVVKVTSSSKNEEEKLEAEESSRGFIIDRKPMGTLHGQSADVGDRKPEDMPNSRPDEITPVEKMDAQPTKAVSLEQESPAPVSQTESGNLGSDATIGSDETPKQDAMDTENLDSKEKKDLLAEQDHAEQEAMDTSEGKKVDLAEQGKAEGEDAPAEPVIPVAEEKNDVSSNEQSKIEGVDALLGDRGRMDVSAEQDKVEGGKASAEPVAPGDDNKDAPVEQCKAEGYEEPAQTAIPGDEEAAISERQKRRKTEIFIGGLDREVKEEDLRKVFMKVGEVVEIRIMMDRNTGKNKGYAFLRYKEPAQAEKAVLEFSKVEICGKLCGAAALEGNDTILLGNIDKKWKKEDVVKLLEGIGIEKIDTVTLMADSNNSDLNKGFAFLELESNRDAQIAYKKLQQKDAFGKSQDIRVSWAEPLKNPDEDEMQKVKSVYVEGIPSSWDEAKMRQIFDKFGELERVVLARNMPSAKRKDFAFVNYTSREAALSCIESFEKEELTENGVKINVKVSLSKPSRKGMQNVGGSKFTSTGKEKHKATQYKGKHMKSGPTFGGGDRKPSMTNDYWHGYREQSAWRQGPVGYPRGPPVPDYPPLAGGKRAYSTMDEGGVYSDFRGYPRPRFEPSFPAARSSYNTFPRGMPGSSQPYYQHPDVGYQGAPYNQGGHPGNFQRQGFPPYGGSNTYPRY